LVIWVRLKIYSEIAKILMKQAGEGECVPGPVNLGAINEMRDAHVKHIKDGKCGFSRRVLQKLISYLVSARVVFPSQEHTLLTNRESGPAFVKKCGRI
jgi:hypothetical protein